MAGIFNRVHGDRSFTANPFRTIQGSGIMWGLGTDARNQVDKDARSSDARPRG